MMRYEYPIMGAKYCKADILAVAEQNKRYSGKIDRKTYQTEPIDAPAQLIPEDGNPADANAVKIMYKGRKIGYAPASDAPIIRQQINQGAIEGVYIKVLGGPYKEINEYGTEAAGETDFYGTLYIDINEQTRRGEINTPLLIVCILFGYMGIHRFMRRQVGIGVLYLLTMGIFGIGWIIDIIRIAAGKMK